MTATVAERFTGAGGDVAGSLTWVTARFGAVPSPAQLAEAARIRLLDERAFGVPRADALQVLSALRDRGLRIGVISDCSAELPQYFGELPIAPYIDVAVFSFVTVHLDVADEAGGVVYGRHESWDGESVRSLTEVLALLD